jgi:hypothetical protein
MSERLGAVAWGEFVRYGLGGVAPFGRRVGEEALTPRWECGACGPAFHCRKISGAACFNLAP